MTQPKRIKEVTLLSKVMRLAFPANTPNTTYVPYSYVLYNCLIAWHSLHSSFISTKKWMKRISIELKEIMASGFKTRWSSNCSQYGIVEATIEKDFAFKVRRIERTWSICLRVVSDWNDVLIDQGLLFCLRKSYFCIYLSRYIFSPFHTTYRSIMPEPDTHTGQKLVTCV